VNADPKILPYTRLIPKIERLEKSDSFQASRKVCTLASHGVAAIFGPQSIESSNHVQSTCDVLQIPHMQIRWDYRLEATNQSVNLFPHPLMLGRGLRDLVKTKNWKNFAILYEDNDGKPFFRPDDTDQH
jgi:ionotropic glutamate receptor